MDDFKIIYQEEEDILYLAKTVITIVRAPRLFPAHVS